MTEMQTSKYAYVTDESTKLSEKLTKRISWITGLQTGRSFDKFEDENTEEYEPLFVSNFIFYLHCYWAENKIRLLIDIRTINLMVFMFKVTNYGVGGHYSLHLDRGSRLATFMIYLSDVSRKLF